MKKLLFLLVSLAIANVATAQENKHLEKQNPEMKVNTPVSSNENPTTSPSLLSPFDRELPPLNNPLHTADSVNFFHQIWSDNDRMNMHLSPFQMPVYNPNLPHQYDYSNAGTIAEYGNLRFYGSSNHTEYTNMMVTQGASLGASETFGAFTLSANLSANRYFTNAITTQYGIGGQLSYQFNSNLSATMFGQYFNRNPYFSMASYPFVQASRYGGFFSIDSKRVGLDLGVQRYYDAFRQMWVISPIVTPKIHFSTKFTMELPVGELLKDVAERAIFGKRSRGPIIMPPGMR